LKDIEKNGYGKCLVLEDDVRFVSDIKRRLNDLTTNLDEIEKWYIVYIGLHSVAAGSYFEDFPIEGSYDSSFFCKKKITDYIGVFNDGFNPCALSYLVNGNNVDQIIEKMTIYPGAADYCYNNILIGLDAFYCALHVLATGNSNLDTTIHRAYNHTDCAYKYKDILSSYKRINDEED
jgi:GR25 family glycosyltransferase involved in LPS biosynthesis